MNVNGEGARHSNVAKSLSFCGSIPFPLSASASGLSAYFLLKIDKVLKEVSFNYF